jgi:hemolysin activation/secretion protein
MPSANKFNIQPVSSATNGQPSDYTSGFQFQYTPLFMDAILSAGYTKDNSQRNTETHAYNASVNMPLGTEGLSASYGLQGYDSRYSSPYFSQSYRGMSPSVGMNYNSGNWNASMQKTQGQSPYFGINYTNRF